MSKLWLFNKKYLYPWQDPDCKGYWKLEEASGTRADATSNANNLTDNNTVTQGTGIRGSCADFESTNSEFLSITHVAQTGLNFAGDFSLWAWLNLESLGTMGIMEKYVTTTKGYSWHFQNNGAPLAAGLLTLRLYKAAGLTDYTTKFAPLVPTYWVFVGVSYDAVADGTSIITMYVNGYKIHSISTAILMAQSDSGVFSLGTVSGANYYDGLMDEACAFNRVLSDDDVLWLYLYGLSKVGGGVYTGTPRVSAGFGGGV